MSASNEVQLERSAIVVGGSLAGLLAAIALASAGVTVTVVERADTPGVDGAMLRVVPSPARIPAAQPTLREIASAGRPTSVEAWGTVHRRLRVAAQTHAAITLREGIAAVSAHQDEHGAWVELADGSTLRGDVVIGADGYRSVVRAAVAPERPDAAFAGYLLWVGRIAERELPRELWLPPGEQSTMDWARTILFAHALPHADGSTRPGDRDIVFAVYDAHHVGELGRLGVLRDGVVLRSLRGDDIHDALLAEVIDDLAAWPRQWAEPIAEAMRRRRITGTPITEYMPDRLVAGRLALVGDAAHVPSPMTGSGFDAAIADAESLLAAVEALDAGEPLASALEAYEAARLRDAQRLVAAGQAFSRSFAEAA